MKLESFIAGTILGVTISNPVNQRTLVGLTRKGASLLIDGLNKRGGLDAPTEKQATEQPTEPIR